MKCVFYALKKRDVDHSKPPLPPIAVSEPWQIIAADCVDPSPVKNLRNRYILVVRDLFTRYIETVALLSVETAIITQVFLDKIVFRNDLPHKFLTDRRANFTSKLMTQLCITSNVMVLLNV